MPPTSEKLPPGATVDSIAQFIYDNWEPIAILAYREYLLQGRGMIAWMWDYKRESGKKNFLYWPEKLAFSFYGSEGILERIRSYDPAKTAVIGVVWQDAITYSGQYAIANDKTYFVVFKKDPSPFHLYMQSSN